MNFMLRKDGAAWGQYSGKTLYAVAVQVLKDFQDKKLILTSISANVAFFTSESGNEYTLSD